jgi:hypothetical protein
LLIVLSFSATNNIQLNILKQIDDILGEKMLRFAQEINEKQVKRTINGFVFGYKLCQPSIVFDQFELKGLL